MRLIWLYRILFGAVAGALIGGLVFWVMEDPSIWKWIGLGVITGILASLVWPLCQSLVVRLKIDDWQLDEVEIQGLKFTSGGAQRRIAWRLFVEISTRIAAQPLSDDAGDDDSSMKSLYDLFQLTRKIILEMEPTLVNKGDTVETFALDMLNSDLRPFLSKWHPILDSHPKGAVGAIWPRRSEYRRELQILQAAIRKRAHGLALIAGVKNVERFFSAN